MYPGVWAQKVPDKAAYICGEETVTYGELDLRSNRLAHLWRDRGLRAADHVAILMENHPRYLEVMWAAFRSGLVITPVNWHLSAAEAEYVVADSGARSLVASERHAVAARTIAESTPTLESVLITDEDVEGLDRYETVIARYPTTPIVDETLGTDMIYTSGTTGRPKGGARELPRIHPADLPEQMLAYFDLFGFGEDMVHLTPGAPLYHAAPLRFSMAVTQAGGTIVVQENFDAAQAMRAIDEHGVTHSQWVPTMFVRMLRLDEAVRNEYRGFRHCHAIHTAAPCPIWVKEQMISWWGEIIEEYYGASEGGAITYISADDWLSHRGSVGKAALGTAIVITDDEGAVLSAGETGVVAGVGTPIEYHNDPEKTANAHDVQGRARIGDVGHLDEDGYLYLTDRQDFTIISGGVNIYPQEAEDVLIRDPRVADVAVIGVPHDELGEEVKAVVELVEADQASDGVAQELIALCREHLAVYKCPRSVDFDQALPRAASGKLYKRRVRDRYWRVDP